MSTSPSSNNAFGVLAMNLAMAGFIINDSFVKAASVYLPLGQLMFLRGLIASVLILGICWWTGAFQKIALLKNRMLAWRVVGEWGATMFYLTALMHLPIGNVTAIFQVSPLAVTAGAAVFLGEKVGWRRWTAIVIGFLGVLIIVRPGFEGFNQYAVFVLISVVFVALRDLSTARLPREMPTFLVTAVTAVMITLTGLALRPFEGSLSHFDTWQTVTPHIGVLLTGAAVFLLVGYIFIIVAMRHGEMSLVAPFRYVILVYAILIGYFVFGDVPDVYMIVGAMIVVASGLYTLWRERVVKAKRPAAPAQPS
jgi:drug/metabolite transporter (DMT)-like permease